LSKFEPVRALTRRADPKAKVSRAGRTITVVTIVLAAVLPDPGTSVGGSQSPRQQSTSIGGKWPMSGSNKRRRRLRWLLLCLGLLAAPWLTGCQVEVGGQLLPSPYYMQDDVQYYPPGPEFKLAREAAALKTAAQEAELRR
jgi:hypothetical protein